MNNIIVISLDEIIGSNLDSIDAFFKDKLCLLTGEVIGHLLENLPLFQLENEYNLIENFISNHVKHNDLIRYCLLDANGKPITQENVEATDLEDDLLSRLTGISILLKNHLSKIINIHSYYYHLKVLGYRDKYSILNLCNTVTLMVVKDE